jgi:hypothetical protein
MLFDYYDLLMQFDNFSDKKEIIYWMNILTLKIVDGKN